MEGIQFAQQYIQNSILFMEYEIDEQLMKVKNLNPSRKDLEVIKLLKNDSVDVKENRVGKNHTCSEGPSGQKSRIIWGLHGKNHS